MRESNCDNFPDMKLVSGTVYLLIKLRYLLDVTQLLCLCWAKLALHSQLVHLLVCPFVRLMQLDIVKMN